MSGGFPDRQRDRQNWKLINAIDPSMYSLALHRECEAEAWDEEEEETEGNCPREISAANNRSGCREERGRNKEEKDGNEVG